MPKIDVYDIKGKKVSDVELNEDIFGIEGFSFNPGGKSIDEWIKEFLTELFGG